MHVTNSQSDRVVEDLTRSSARTEARSHKRASVFKTILKAAAAAVPIAGPIISAVADTIDRNRSPLLDSFGGESETIKYLELQREIQQETRRYEATSNVMKARHDATMSSIRNLRS